ncbi:hypothetical protein ACS0TY_026191 [Phlomoides rotata]
MLMSGVDRLIKICPVVRKNAQAILLVRTILHRVIVIMSIGILFMLLKKHRTRCNVQRMSFSVLDKIPAQIKHMHDLVEVSDEDCKNHLRMDRLSFSCLCNLLKSVGGLKSSKNVTVAEKLKVKSAGLESQLKTSPLKISCVESAEAGLSRSQLKLGLKCKLKLTGDKDK